MGFFDLPLDQLEKYTPTRTEPSDFDSFWKTTLEDARSHPLNATFTPYDAGLKLVEVYDLTYNGYGGQPIKGWYLRPAGVTQKLPCVVEFIGYGGGRSFPYTWLHWANVGYATLVMDTRGQGSSWSHGDTPDLPDGANPAYSGFMTQGIFDPRDYYYRRVYTDAARAVEAAKTRSDVDPSRIAVTGGSQGGGLSIAAAALSTDVAVCMPDVPFLCQFREAVGKTDDHPYQEIVRFLSVHRDKVERVFSTLDYFDGVNLAARIKAECLFSTGLLDMVCPPSTVFAAYNQIQAPKAIKVYKYNGHEGGGEHHKLEKTRYLTARWG